MAVWTEEGYNERRALMLSQYAVGMAPLSAVAPLDEDDIAFVEDVHESYRKAKEAGIENPIFDIVYD